MFRLQFVQRYLTGPKDVVWTSSILRKTAGLGLDTALFLMDLKFLKHPFYEALFKTWNIFKWKRLELTSSLHWLLEEPLINKARLYVQDSTTPGLTSMLCTTGAVTLRRIVDVAGPGLTNNLAVASLLGQRSIRQTKNIVNMWTERLTEEEIKMLSGLSTGL